MAQVDLKENLRHLRSKIKTQGAEASLSSAFESEFQKSLMTEISKQQRHAFVFSPKLSIYATNNSFASHSNQPSNYRQSTETQKDVDAMTGYDQNGFDGSHRYPGANVPNTAPKMGYILSGE